MRILGIDPGYDIVGWGIIESDLSIVDYGIIKTSPADRIEERFYQIYCGLNELIEKYSPERAGLERLFFKNNSTTAMSVAGAVGVVMLMLRMHNIPFQEYTPTEVKHVVTGSGRAGKEQVQLMMTRILKQKKISGPDDAADALAVALCHCLRSSGRE